MIRLLSGTWTRLFFLFLCSANMCFYWSRLERSSRAVITPSTDHTRAKPLTDLYPPWLAARELLLNGRDPYGPYVTREIQIAYFGSELDASRAEVLSDAQRFSLAYRFAYPLYAVLFVAPTIGMEFHTAQIVSWCFLALVTCVGGYLWLRFVRLQLRWSVVAALFAIFLSSIPVMQGLSVLQLGLLVAALIAAAALSAARGHLFLAGAFLALATIRPQMSVLVIAWFALWLSAAWSERRSLLWGFGTTLAALLLASEYLQPGWLLRYPGVLTAYGNYTGAASFLGLLMPSSSCWLLTVGALFAGVPFCWRIRRQSANSASFALALAFVMTLTVSIVPTVVASFNQVLLLPAMLLVIHHWSDLRKRTLPVRIASLVFCALAFLPWLLALVVTMGPALQQDSLSKMWFAPLKASLALPFVVFGILILLRHVVSSPPALSSGSPLQPTGPAPATRQP